jgi:hypothetical protein
MFVEIKWLRGWDCVSFSTRLFLNYLTVILLVINIGLSFAEFTTGGVRSRTAQNTAPGLEYPIPQKILSGVVGRSRKS